MFTTSKSKASSSGFSRHAEKFRQAQLVCANIPLAYLLQCTVTRAERTGENSSSAINQIYFKYPALKTFAHPEIFPQIAHFIVDECMQYRQRFETFSVHVDVEGLTVGAVDRYKDLISNVLLLCEALQTDFSSSICAVHLYNTPPSIDMIRPLLLPFLVAELREKLIFH